MARFTVIGDVTLELRAQIYAALDGAPFVDFGLAPISQAIYVGPPDGDDIDDNAVVALYLYQVLPSGHLRNQRLLPDSENPSRFRKPPLPLELRYIVIPLENDETGHQHLGRIVQHFHDHHSFDTLDGEPLGDSFGGAASTLRVGIDPLNMDQLTQLWSAFSSPFRLSLGLRVELVAIDSGLPLETLPRIDETVLVTGTMA
ncbi:DUF4255 domain-containing protein [Sphingomonas sp. DT-207]|uniref:DUF4255 domain-containing protein n=1 Tax=Sphingomonas sp. DT-207 TaxID=3396167 RepID=UPI003F1B9E31